MRRRRGLSLGLLLGLLLAFLVAGSVVVAGGVYRGWAGGEPAEGVESVEGVERAEVVQRGEGSFTAAGGAAERVGAGRVLRYRVEVEDGIGQDPAEFAGWVDRVLADRRGWTANKQWAFERSRAARPDFVVRLASPSTVDEICGRYGLDTGGEASCRGGENVMINLRRWLLAIPAYEGDVEAYRPLVINHEVGHFLGYDHVGCSGPGELARVMQTQMYGLDGCVPNGWPYPRN